MLPGELPASPLQESKLVTGRRANSSVLVSTQQRFSWFEVIQLCLMAAALLLLGLLLVVACIGVYVISQELHAIAEAAKGPSAGAAVCHLLATGT